MSLKKLGRYDLIRVLGKGAMGLVYEGRDPNLDRRVAIKTIKVENLSEEAAAEYEVRFRTEARSAARLQHPNIVSVYDAGRDGDIAFLVMEFIQGDDLKHHLDKGDLYTLEQTLGSMSDLLSALDYAHRQNIVHRDIKPANLLIEASGRVKLTDFGVARIQDSGEATRTQGSMVGTLKYMSPEQVQGRPIDARADLFAAGIVLYQLLTGQRPFDGDTDFAIIQQIVGHTPLAPTSFNPKLPPAIDAVVARALVKSREQRFATAQEFAAALQAASREAADSTVVPPAGPPGPGRTSTWTATLRPGESLMSTQPGSSAGVSTVTQELELVYWKDIKESSDVEDIQGFLDKFPSGIYAGLARRRLRKLGALPGEDSDIGARSGTGTLVMPRSATQMDKTVLTPRSGTSGTAGTAGTTGKSPEDVDSAWTALEAVAAQTPVQPPAQAVPAASLSDDPEATRLVSAPEVPEAPGMADASVAQPEPVSPQRQAMAPSPAAQAAPPAPTSRRWTWTLAGMVALTGAGLGFKLLSGSSAPPAAPAAPTMTATKATTEVSASLPVVDAATAQAAAPAASTPVAIAAAKKLANDKDRLAKQAQAKPATSAVAPATTEHTAPAAAAVAATHPRQACEDRMLIGFQICMAEQCAKPAFSHHPVCVERRAIEQRRRDAEQLRR